MIIYGSRATHIGTIEVNEKCPNCETQNSVTMAIFQRYAHVFWIPFVPIGKKVITQCSHCEQVLNKKEFPSNFQSYYETLKIRSKTPIWTFTGITLLALLILWLVISGIQDDKKDAALIQSPQTGDIYEAKTEDGNYTIFKVKEVVGDTVFLLLSEYETNKITGLSDIKKKGDEAYFQEPLSVHKEDLKALLEEGKIIDVDRE